MAEQTTSSITIAAAAADVMEVIADLESYPEWTASVREVEVLTVYEDDERPAEARFVLDAGAIKDTYTLSYEWDDDEQVRWTLVEGGLLRGMDGSYTLEELRGRLHRGDLRADRRHRDPDVGTDEAQGREDHHRHGAQGAEEAGGELVGVAIGVDVRRDQDRWRRGRRGRRHHRADPPRHPVHRSSRDRAQHRLRRPGAAPRPRDRRRDRFGRLRRRGPLDGPIRAQPRLAECSGPRSGVRRDRPAGRRRERRQRGCLGGVPLRCGRGRRRHGLCDRRHRDRRWAGPRRRGGTGVRTA